MFIEVPVDNAGGVVILVDEVEEVARAGAVNAEVVVGVPVD